MAKAPGGQTKRSPAPRPSTKTNKTGHASAARRRVEAEQRRRTRILTATLASALVVVLIVVLIVVKLAGGKSTTTVAAPPTSDAPTPSSVLTSLAAIPATQLAQASQAVGSNVKAPSAITDAALTDGGKPEVLYIGAGFCPYCAAERWPLVTALLQFGTFTGLSDSHSSSVDTNPNTPTFSFHGATYSSPYLSFVGVETTTNQRQGNFYAPLDQPTPAQQALIQKYNGGYIPFVDFGGRYLIKAPQYNGKILAGLTVEQVAAQATNPSTTPGLAIEASAAHLVAALCQLTGGKPATVCAAFPTATGA
jgi:hypothetical protein